MWFVVFFTTLVTTDKAYVYFSRRQKKSEHTSMYMYFIICMWFKNWKATCRRTTQTVWLANMWLCSAGFLVWMIKKIVFFLLYKFWQQNDLISSLFHSKCKYIHTHTDNTHIFAGKLMLFVYNEVLFPLTSKEHWRFHTYIVLPCMPVPYKYRSTINNVSCAKSATAVVCKEKKKKNPKQFACRCAFI